MTALVQIEAPAVAFITPEQVKEQARTFHSKEPEVFQRAVDAAISMADGPNGVLGRALITQKWTLIAPNFRETIPLGRLQSVDEVRYLDDDGVESVLPDTEYRALAVPDNSRIFSGKTLPTTLCAPDAVQIDFTAGYGDTADDIPSEIISATLLLAVHLFQERAATMIDPRASEVSRLVELGYASMLHRFVLMGRGA